MNAHVLYFGGYQATVSDIKAWTASASTQKVSVLFDGYAYPDGASWDGGEAVKAFKYLDEAVKKIESCTREVIYIVGHSSGCAIANRVDEKLKDHKRIVLVALDGYSPSDAQLARGTTQLWTAASGTGKAMHYADMLERAKDYNRTAKDPIKANVYTAANSASTKLALHFSLVNVASSDDLVKHIPDGYKQCKANLCWLP
jgi:hypothetical protein